ncbi:MAG: mannose-1-phosphate guanylyltransferase [Alistipes sp.]|nr:mannose-1-phosphate guanylyltransferase [Candidatus Minthomonas equi]
MKENHYCVIMAGGVGSRFWPMSRNDRPKQFLDILGTGRSFLQQTFDRFACIIPVENILIVTSEAYNDLVQEQLPQLPKNNILLEKYRRNTAPCIAYASMKIRKRNPDAVMVVTPADHYIGNVENFTELINSVMTYLDGRDEMYTIGVPPTRPETGYGYIQYNRKMEVNAGGHSGFKIKTFTEKPDRNLATVFIESGEFLWNSGIFIWPVKTICRALEKWLPGIYEAFDSCHGIYDTESEQAAVDNAYEGSERISIDYGIMEKTEQAWVVKASFPWSDLGTWESLYIHSSDKDSAGNLIRTDEAMLSETTESIALSQTPDKLVVVKGLKNYMVIDTENVLLVCPRDEKKFKEVIAELQLQDLKRFQ